MVSMQFQLFNDNSKIKYHNYMCIYLCVRSLLIDVMRLQDYRTYNAEGQDVAMVDYHNIRILFRILFIASSEKKKRP